MPVNATVVCSRAGCTTAPFLAVHDGPVGTLKATLEAQASQRGWTFGDHGKALCPAHRDQRLDGKIRERELRTALGKLPEGSGSWAWLLERVSLNRLQAEGYARLRATLTAALGLSQSTGDGALETALRALQADLLETTHALAEARRFGQRCGAVATGVGVCMLPKEHDGHVHVTINGDITAWDSTGGRIRIGN